MMTYIFGKKIKRRETMAGCARPVAQVEQACEFNPMQEQAARGEEKKMVLVGKRAPVFKAPAFHDGAFTEIDLEDYRGQWVMLCF